MGLGDLSQNPSAFPDARSTKALQGSAVGFVVGGFKDIWDRQMASDGMNGFRHLHGMRFTFDHAWPSNKEEVARSNVYAANLKLANKSLHTPSLSCRVSRHQK
jgi:hypothetical protein